MPIQVLPPQLANQIAAGEVVERPASVVKELVENSLDAGATKIDIDIDRGGIKLIRIRDNGCGIAKEELSLALARHATSKISSLDDLEAIASLGFRGEALASISSVSRLTLTSRPAAQKEAWQAYAEGREMKVDIKPAAHPVGCTIEVLDLFYNTPARRKFLKTEKTEFSHIDEVVRRIALVRFDVSFNLHHNGKLIRQYRAVTDNASQDKRVAAICGQSFIDQAVRVDWQHDDLSIHGWIASPQSIKQLADLQYSYVNGRMIRDKVINHAIRQAYQSTLPNEQQPAYVLYISVDPHQVDVNVHPAKHEVRFHQSRLVHDFIYQAVVTALQQFDVTNDLFLTQAQSNEDVSISNKAIVSEPIADSTTDHQSAVNNTKVNNAVINRPAAGKNSFAQVEQTVHTTGGYSGSSSYNKNKPSEKHFAREQNLYQQLISSVDNESGSIEHPESVQQKPAIFPDRKQLVSQVPEFNLSQQAKIGKVLAVWQNHYAIVEYHHGIGLLSLSEAEKRLKACQLSPISDSLKAQPLLIPLRLTLSELERQGYTQYQEVLQRLGIEIKLQKDRAEVRAVPLPLRQQNLPLLLPMLFSYLNQHNGLLLEQIVEWLVKQLGSDFESWNQSQAISVLTELERLCPNLLSQPIERLIQPIDLDKALLALKHE